MIIKNITPSDIQIGLAASDWKDAIAKAAKPLLDSGNIEQSYIDAMINSLLRNGPYIVLGKNIALAHARPECGVNRLGLKFATLNPPIEFGAADFDPIKLLITLAAIDSDSHINLLSDLAEILMDEDRVQELINAKDGEEFCAILRR